MKKLAFSLITRANQKAINIVFRHEAFRFCRIIEALESVMCDVLKYV